MSFGQGLMACRPQRTARCQEVHTLCMALASLGSRCLTMATRRSCGKCSQPPYMHAHRLVMD